MSYKNEDKLRLNGVDTSLLSDEDLSTLFRETLEKGTHGICFSPYIGEQRPGSFIDAKQIRERLEILSPFTKWIRTFSCTEGNELIPSIAHQMGFKTMVGAWLDKDSKSNKIEIQRVIDIAQSGLANIVAVGNEVMYRGDMEEAELIDYILEVKEALPGINVGYVDAYYEFTKRPAITEVCDIILANCYPFWEGCAIEYSHVYLKNMYHEASKAAKGKQVIITESGWPDAGTAKEAAIPSKRNAMQYFINTQEWATQEDIELFYFSSFDESWKVGDEGDVGAHWGLWENNGNMKG